MNNTVYLLIFIGILSSCGVKKELFVAPKDSIELIEEVNSRNTSYQRLTLQAKAHVLTENQDLKINISIKNKRDSIIWVSAKGPFGIEIFRAQLTPDSLYFLNRINKTYFIKSTSNAQSFISTSASFYDLQDFISNNITIPRDNYKFTVDEEGFHLSQDSISYSVNDRYRVYNYKFIKNNTAFELIANNYKDEYAFPKKLKLKFNSQNFFEITINYLNFEFEKPQKIIFNIPNAYDRLK